MPARLEACGAWHRTCSRRMTFETWLAFAALELVLSLTPGPAVVLVLSQAIAFGTAASVFASLGILAANAVYFALSGAGLGAVLLASETLFGALRWAGVAYLVVTGLRLLRKRPDDLPLVTGTAETGRALPLFARGFLLQIANPKALVFFTALLPPFLSPRHDLVPQVLLLGATSVVLEFLVLLGYGVAAERSARLLPRARVARLQTRIAGVGLIAAALGVSVVRQP
jgi:homoserine/homoserine lactone efflux protein